VDFKIKGKGLMSEQSMKCKDCVLKHIANAMSYAKEILAGHGIGGTPDHRPDYLGELVNAENHLEHISIELLNRVMALRTAAQVRRMVPVESDIDTLRELWIAVEATEVPEGVVSSGRAISTNPSTPVEKLEVKTKHVVFSFPDMENMTSIGILLDNEWYKEENKEKLTIFKKLIDKYADNGILLDNDSLNEYSEKYLWIFPINTFVNKKTDMTYPILANVSEGRKNSFIMRVVPTSDFKERLKNNPSSTYTEILDSMTLPKMPPVTEESAVVYVTRKPCCSIKSRLTTNSFVKVNEEGWPYMKEIWETI
jgi:hypothetical protein